MNSLIFEIDNTSISDFHTKLFSWFQNNKKEYPWRETDDPYKIMVSEFMLQQTQTSRVVPKYLEFIKNFPTMQSLAQAETRFVLELWSGLGYNRRALWLKEACLHISTRESFPKEISDLKKIKGIGNYTSRAILIFAFNKDVATVDTNIRRIFIAEGFANEETSEKELFMIAERLLPKGKSREYHSALMDYGNEIVTSKNTKIKPKTIQSKFENSNRQYRGKIVKFLTKNDHSTLFELAIECQIPQEKLEEILNKLVKDNLIVKEGEKFKIV